MGLFGKKTTVVHFNDCTKCNGQGSYKVTVDRKKEDGGPFKIRQTCTQCSGTGNKGSR